MGYMNEERLMIQQTARQFSMKEVLPVANALDPIQGDIPLELRQKMADMGYFGIRIKEEFGGLGLGCFEYCLIAEELARGWMSVASIIARSGGMMGLGNMNRVRSAVELTRKAARGEYLAAAALSEPNVGSDLSGVSCRAERRGDHWYITGNKYWCTFADGADYISVLARTSERDPTATVERTGPLHRSRSRAASCRRAVKGSPIPKIGYFGWKTWELRFDDCKPAGRVPDGQ
jgi:alkylation response protein AidB-like acyl-CoA dehydrogenase